MISGEDEDRALRSVVTQNAQSILLVRQRAEQELLQAKNSLERKTDELAHSLSVMQATLDATWDAILVTDGQGRITGYNRTYTDMWGIPAPLMAGGHHELLRIISQEFADPSRFVLRVEEIYAGALPESFDLLELRDGRTVERFSKRLLMDDAANGRVWSFRDITRQRKVEQALRDAAEERRKLLDSERSARSHAERMSEIKDEFLATLSHELRTPLSAILGWSHLLRRGSVRADDIPKAMEVIERNARMQKQLIEDLLDMSRITSGKVRLDVQVVPPLSCIEAAIETVRPAAEAKGIRLERDLDPLAGPVAGDPDRLQQIVWNLLSNAIKFTPQDGTVSVLLARADSHVEIVVADSGIGISTEFLDYVFDRFRQADNSTTRKYEGLGLGLSIVKHLVELHGGTVSAQSEGEGRGAAFTVRLPIVTTHQGVDQLPRVHADAAPPVLTEFDTLDLSGVRVLVVDDEADSRLLLERVLAQSRADVVLAENGELALHAIASRDFDVMVSDISMPGMDGYELLHRARVLDSRGEKLPAIALTAFARSEDRTRALRAGFQAHIAKPVEPAELIASVASLVGRTGRQVVRRGPL